MPKKAKSLPFDEAADEELPPLQSALSFSSLQMASTTVEAAKNCKGINSVVSQNDGELRFEGTESNRIVSPNSLAHRSDLTDIDTANLSPCTAILSHEKKFAFPNYSTTIETVKNSADEVQQVKVGRDDVIVDDNIDVYFLGEQLNEVLEASVRSTLSISQGVGAQNTVRRAVLHIFKGNVGAGVFLLPTYYRDAGYGVGVVVVLILGIIVIDCVLALVYAKQKINLTEVRTYPAVVGHVLGDALMYFTKFSLIFTQFGFCVVYFQYASSLFAALFTTVQTYRFFVFLSILVVTPMTFVSHRIGLLSYASMLATVFVAIVLAGALGEEVHHLATYGIAKETVPFVSTARVLVFLSGHMFALEGIGIVLPVENSMLPADRPFFYQTVKYTLSFVILLYVIFGVFGYLAFGDALETSMVLAMPQGTTKTLLQVFLGLSLIFGYPIQYVPAIQLVDWALGINTSSSCEMAFFVRILLNAFFGILALFIGSDTINTFASFLGAFTGVHLMITVPVFLSLFTDRVISEERVVGPFFSDYVKWFFTRPRTIAEYRWYAYFIFAIVVWLGGTYYTFESVFQ